MKRVGYLREEDFQRLREYYGGRIAVLQRQSESSEVSGALTAARQAFYLQRYVEDMAHFGWPALTQRLEQSFAAEFGDARILSSIHDRVIHRILPSLAGQQTFGENRYVVHHGIAYMRTLRGDWLAANSAELFLLLPTPGQMAPSEIISPLEAAYSPTATDELFSRWAAWPNGSADASSLFYFTKGTTTPEQYAHHVNRQIAEILRVRPSVADVEGLHDHGPRYLETLFRVAERIVSFVKTLRASGRTPLYLLRDGMMFSEAHTAIDLLQKQTTPQAKAMIGRKLLSLPDEPERYWRMVVDALYAAWGEHSDDFTLFSRTFGEQLHRSEARDPQLAGLFARLAQYLKDCLPPARGQVVVVDTGLQGSVNMLVAYLLGGRAEIRPLPDIFMYVVGEWFRGVYRGRYASEYYPMMKDIEILSRSEDLYAYAPGSFERGRLEVQMGGHEQQLRANIELIVLTIVCTLITEAAA